MLFNTEIVAQKERNAYVGLEGKEKGGERGITALF